MESKSLAIDTESVKSRMFVIRGQAALLDRDVASLYGVETREINQAVRNNPDKFPDGYVFELEKSEEKSLRSKNLILETYGQGRGMHSKRRERKS